MINKKFELNDLVIIKVQKWNQYYHIEGKITKVKKHNKFEVTLTNYGEVHTVKEKDMWHKYPEIEEDEEYL